MRLAQLFGRTIPKSIYVRVFLAFIAAGVVPISLGGFLYSQNRMILSTMMDESRTAALELGTALLESRLNEIESLTIRLSSDPLIQQSGHFIGPIRGTIPIRLLESSHQLTRQVSRDDLVSGVWIYYPKLDFILGSSGNYPFVKEQYGGTYRWGELSYTDFKSAVLQGFHDKTLWPSVEIVDAGVTRRLLPYIQSIPFGSAEPMQMVIIVFIEEEAIASILDTIRLLDSGFSAIYDPNGELISSRGDLPAERWITPLLPAEYFPGEDTYLKNAEFLFSRTYADDPIRLLVTTGVPLHIAMHRMNEANRIALLVLIGSLLGYGAVSAALTTRLSRPFAGAVTRLIREYRAGDNPDVRDPFSQVNTLLDRVFEERSALEEQITGQRRRMVETWLRMSLDGGAGSPGFLNALQQDLGQPPENCTYCIILCRVAPIAETQEGVELVSRSSVLITQSFKENLPTVSFTVQPQVLGLLVYCHVDASKFHGIIDSVIDSLLNDAVLGETLDLFFALGGTAESLRLVQRSYRQALQVLDSCGDIGRGNVVYFDEADFSDEPYTISPGSLANLTQWIRSGAVEKVQRHLDDLLPDDSIHNRQSAETTGLLVHELWLTLAKVVQSINARMEQSEHRIDDPYLPSSPLPHERLESIKEQILQITEQIGKQGISNRSELVEKTKEYLDANFHNPNLTLSSVAERMGVTGAHLSRTFTQEINSGFHHYLTSLRIDAAKKRLRGSVRNLESVWKSVGFSSSATFRRVFKEREGMTPGTFVRRNKA